VVLAGIPAAAKEPQTGTIVSESSVACGSQVKRSCLRFLSRGRNSRQNHSCHQHKCLSHIASKGPHELSRHANKESPHSILDELLANSNVRLQPFLTPVTQE
jgi:hypothetical protein